MTDQKTAPKEFVKHDPQIRRIVTGHDGKGKSVIAIDSLATNHKFPNESTEPRCSVTVLVEANPKRADSVSGATRQKH